MMTKEEIMLQLKALPIEERISIIQELLETIKPKHPIDISETSLMTRTLTPESLFREFVSQGKIIHTSPPIEHDEPVLGAGGAIPISSNKLS